MYNFRQSGVVFGLANTFANFNGLFISLTVGALTTNVSLFSYIKVTHKDQSVSQSKNVVIWKVQLNFKADDTVACIQTHIFMNIPFLCPYTIYNIKLSTIHFKYLFILVYGDQGTQEEWQKVFYISGGVLLAGIIIFVIFASGEQQVNNTI